MLWQWKTRMAKPTWAHWSHRIHFLGNMFEKVTRLYVKLRPSVSKITVTFGHKVTVTFGHTKDHCDLRSHKVFVTLGHNQGLWQQIEFSHNHALWPSVTIMVVWPAVTIIDGVTFGHTRSMWPSRSPWPSVTSKSVSPSVTVKDIVVFDQYLSHVFHYFPFFWRSLWPWVKVMATKFIIFIKPLL